MPNPSVVKAQLPVMTRCKSDSGFPAIRMDCGSDNDAPRNSTNFLIHAAHSQASQRIWRRLRKARSALLPMKPRSQPLVKGITRRHEPSSSSTSRNSAKAKSENEGDAKARDDCG